MCRRLIIYVTDYTKEEEPYIRWSKKYAFIPYYLALLCLTKN